MIIKAEIGNLRECFYADPKFDNTNKRIILEIMKTAQVKQGETWDDIGVAVYQKTVIINDNKTIDPITYTFSRDETAVPAYSYLISRTVAHLGVVSLDEYIYAVIAGQIEKYLTANNLV